MAVPSHRLECQHGSADDEPCELRCETSDVQQAQGWALVHSDVLRDEVLAWIDVELGEDQDACGRLGNVVRLPCGGSAVDHMSVVACVDSVARFSIVLDREA